MFFRKKARNSDYALAGNCGFTEESRAEAIRNLCGNEALYEKYLSRFRESRGNSAAEIRTLFEAGDFENARIQSHSLKGLAATLGLLSISQTAASLEKMFLDLSKNPIDENALFSALTHLERELAAVCR